ncbi:glycoside hydrolase family 31 protein [Halobacillus amylolyticus]|uniref:Glycoside hydrolase family 31 protein n=1 Tax=Halobacillus amylolyticus TaxID=2932259 RepID=A0ABY4H819_9BACI|nr:glycoside hydrolase family 31 protein [Halobacillus amylolyticus]UOR11004.1 glycoside hydrolase family 31 protein [Halobacillus amylolyticus]
MQDTSFAIHPGKKNQLKDTTYHDIGNLKHVKKSGKDVQFTGEQGYVKIRFYRSDSVRVVMNPFEEPSMKSSFALVKEPEDVKIVVNEETDSITIDSSHIKLVVKRKPFRISAYDANARPLVLETEMGMVYKENKEVICFKKMSENDHFYGFGEKAGFLDKRGEKYTMWNSDVYAPHNPETNALYESIPYFMTLRDGKAHGIYFDNTFKTVFDMKTGKNTYSFSADGGQIDYYILAGPTPKDVVEQYTDLTGRMPLPPKWSLGYHQSRYSYETEKEVRELANTFLEKGIPLDAIYLDIHYMDGYRVFTFDHGRFPTPGKMIQDLKVKGIRTVPIVDPGVKEDPEYAIYSDGILGDLFCKYLEGNIFFGDVWPGNSAFPDFTNSKVRKWWGRKHKFYTDLGIEGIWNDMNEPAVFNETKTMDVKVMHDNDGDLKTHREMHNVYGLYMGESTYNGMKSLLDGKRPFLLTRAGFSGVQRYGAVWTGDNRSFWEHLSMALPMCMNLGLSGVAFTGPDVGGFAHGTSAELLARWTQFGTFTPYFRNHSALEFARQEPWSFGEKYESIIKKYIELRYKWLPHLYTLFKEASETGVPVMRPLLMESPYDSNTYKLSDQFLIGENVIIAPILKPDTRHRVVYLPEGDWYDYWNDHKYRGGNHVLVEADLDTLPIFIKAGAVLSEGEVKQSTAVADEKMTIHVYPVEEGQSAYTFYDDDGETFAYQDGITVEKRISCYFDENTVKITIDEQNSRFEPKWEKVTFVLHDQTKETAVIVDDRQLDENELTFNCSIKTLTFNISM